MRPPRRSPARLETTVVLQRPRPSDVGIGLREALQDVNIQVILLSEFSRYYRGDEVETRQREQLQRRAEASAQQLKAVVGKDGVASLVALLEALRDDRLHPMHFEIGSRSGLCWSDDDNDFAAFQELAGWMIARLASPL